MDIDSIMQARQAQENTASSQISEALNAMRSEVEKSNEEMAKRLRPKKDHEPSNLESETPSPKLDEAPKETKTENITTEKKHLIFFSFQISYDLPPWVLPLRQALVKAGYFVYSPAERIVEQFGKPDLEGLNSLEKKLVKPLCATLGLNENLLHPFEVVANILDQGDKGDSFASVFKAQWFLSRSSVLISDLVFAGPDSSQELFLAKQLGIPSIGMFPPSGQITPWQHQNCTLLYTPQNLQYIFPLILGLSNG